MLSSRYFEPLRHHDFALLWSGQTASQLGDGVFTVTLAIEALRLDRRAIGLAYGTVMFNPLIQQGVPDALLGRVASVDYLLGFALGPLGLVAAGAAADAVGVRATLVVGGAVTALTTVIPLLPGVEDPTGPRVRDRGAAG